MSYDFSGIHVLWDNDATLVDSEIIAMPHAVDSVFDYLESVGLGSNIPRKPYVVQWAGEQITQMFATVDGWFPSGEAGLTAEKIAELSADDARRVIEALKDVKVIDGITEALQQITDQGGTSSVVTSSSLLRVVPGLENNGLVPFFTHNGQPQIWSATETLIADKRYGRAIPKSATSPEIYHYALEATHAQHGKVIAIEDSGSGVGAAIAAGIPVVGTTAASHISPETKVSHGEGLIKKASSVLGRNATEKEITIVQDPREIPEVIGRMLGLPVLGINLDFPYQ